MHQPKRLRQNPQATRKSIRFVTVMPNAETNTNTNTNNNTNTHTQSDTKTVLKRHYE